MYIATSMSISTNDRDKCMSKLDYYDFERTVQKHISVIGNNCNRNVCKEYNLYHCFKT